MKTPSLLQLTSILMAVAMLGQAKLQAQSWQTVLDFQLAAGASSAGLGIATDSAGNVFSGGYGDIGGVYHGLVLKTDTTESNWFLSDATNPSPGQDNSLVFGVGVDPIGNVFSTGWLQPPCAKKSCPGQYWYVRKSANAGGTWSTVDLFQYAPGQSAYAYGVASDNAGNVFVAGLANDAKRVGHWVVRKSPNAGASWTVVDDVPWGTPSQFTVMTFVPGAGLFVVGSAYSNSLNAWVVRRSLDGGSTWANADNYQLTVGQESYARGVSSDAQGNIYVVGYAHDSTATARWIVRASGNGGATWTTIDSFSYVAGKPAVGHAIGRDSLGQVAVAGVGQDSQGTSHWLVRRPSASGPWATVDDYQLAPGQNTDLRAVATDAAGNVLVSGDANDTSGTHWIVRRTNP